MKNVILKDGFDIKHEVNEEKCNVYGNSFILVRWGDGPSEERRRRQAYRTDEGRLLREVSQ